MGAEGQPKKAVLVPPGFPFLLPQLSDEEA